jgi:hypothetical protein
LRSIERLENEVLVGPRWRLADGVDDVVGMDVGDQPSRGGWP